MEEREMAQEATLKCMAEMDSWIHVRNGCTLTQHGIVVYLLRECRAFVQTVLVSEGFKLDIYTIIIKREFPFALKQFAKEICVLLALISDPPGEQTSKEVNNLLEIWISR
jgi:hypothetical protein